MRLGSRHPGGGTRQHEPHLGCQELTCQPEHRWAPTGSYALGYLGDPLANKRASDLLEPTQQSQRAGGVVPARRAEVPSAAACCCPRPAPRPIHWGQRPETYKGHLPGPSHRQACHGPPRPPRSRSESSRRRGARRASRGHLGESTGRAGAHTPPPSWPGTSQAGGVVARCLVPF